MEISYNWNSPNFTNDYPQSSFVLSVAKPNDTQTLVLLDQAVSQGYVPAIIYSLNLVREEEQPGMKMNLLTTAAIKYQNPDALFLLAVEFIKVPSNVQNGFSILLQLSTSGHYEATVYVALLLSPLSEYQYQEKNPEASYNILQECLKIKADDVLVLYELAKLTYDGVGTEQNIEGAQELYERAKAIKPDLLPLGKSDTSPLVPVKILSACGIVIMTCLIFLSIYNSTRKN